MTRRHKIKYSKPPYRKKKTGKLVVVVTEGEKTEPEYFKKLKLLNSGVRNRKIKICNCKGGNVSQIVERMNNVVKDDELDKGDEKWIVVDDDERDDSTVKILLDWQKEAPKFNRLAASNPLFEYWLLLHFEDGNSVSSKKDCEVRLENCLKKELQNNKYKYKKVLPSKFITLKTVGDAIKRAIKKDLKSWDEWPEIRCTRVYKLVEIILKGKLNIK